MAQRFMAAEALLITPCLELFLPWPGLVQTHH
jgi:hypothetical protein